jgi:hypothetical protein
MKHPVYIFIYFYQLLSVRQYGEQQWFSKRCFLAFQPLDKSASPRSFIVFSRHENISTINQHDALSIFTLLN